MYLRPTYDQLRNSNGGVDQGRGGAAGAGRAGRRRDNSAARAPTGGPHEGRGERPGRELPAAGSARRARRPAGPLRPRGRRPRADDRAPARDRSQTPAGRAVSRRRPFSSVEMENFPLDWAELEIFTE